jgi:hypothetical protein
VPDIVGGGVGDCSKVGRAENVNKPDAVDDADVDALAVRSAGSDLLGVGDPLWLRSAVKEVTVETLLEGLGDTEN